METLKIGLVSSSQLSFFGDKAGRYAAYAQSVPTEKKTMLDELVKKL